MVLHVAGSGRAIVKITGEAAEGDILYDKRGAKIGRIREIMGPVASPYASTEILTNNIKRQMGAKLWRRNH